MDEALSTGLIGPSDGLDEIPFEAIAARMRDGRVVPFLGAGASASGVPDGPHRLPRGRELAQELADVMKPYPGEAHDALTKVTQYWVECVLGRRDLYEHLRRRFFEEQQGAELNVTAQLLAGIDGIPCIVTTNYDDHIEEAFRRRGRDFVVLTHETIPGRAVTRVQVTASDGERKDVLTAEFVLSEYKGKTVIYKMHGAVTPSPDEGLDTVVITEDDYINFLAHTSQLPPQALIAHFARSRFLFLGYSLEDWNFRVVLRRLTDETQGAFNMHWAVQRHPSEIEKLFWLRRNVRLFDASLEDFVSKMREALVP